MAYKSHREADFPAFLELASQRKWSCEIINEARNAMRAVDTRRPFTPQANTRTLFGGTSRTSNTGRPASQFSLRSLDLADSRPVSGMLKLQPIHGASLPDGSGGPYRSLPRLPSLDFNSSGSFRRPSRRSSLGNLAEEPSNVEEEELAEAVRAVRKAFSGPKERTPHFPGLVAGRPETDLTLTSLDESQKAIRLPHRLKKSRTSSGRGLIPLPPPATPPSLRKKQPAVAEVKKPRLDSEEEAEFFETCLQPLVNAIKDADPDEATEKLILVYEALEEHGYFRSQEGPKKRTPVVRLLSPFVDHSSPKFLLQLACILLALKLRGNNLTNVWKLVFKIARSDKNDSLFLQDSILDLIVESVGNLDPVEEAEPCIYAYGAIKFLTTNPKLLARVNQAGILPLMILHLRLLAAEREAPSFPGKTTTTSSREQMGQVLYQLTGGFRNVVGGDTAALIAQNGSLSHLATVANLFVRDVDIVSNMARIFSVLAANEPCCDAMGSADMRPLFLPVYFAFLSKYPGRQDVVVRIAYVLGNLMAKRDEARMDYFGIDGAADGLMDLLSIYVRKDIGGAANPSSRRQSGTLEKTTITDDTQSGGDGSSGTPTDVIIKVIRVIANMSIGAKVGASLAGNHRCLDHLLAVVRHKEVAFGAELDSVARREDTEAVLSALAALNNLAYYSASDVDSAICQRATEVTEYLCDILLLGHKEATIEVLRVLGNLTRNDMVRDLLSNRRIFDFLIGILDSDCREAVYSACGVLVNMMTDPTRRTILKDLDGISRLIAVLKEMGPSDWQLASLVVQVLWNACAGLDDPGDYLGDEEADALMDVIEDLLDIKDGSKLYSDFSLVANQFLDRLEDDDVAE